MHLVMACQSDPIVLWLEMSHRLNLPAKGVRQNATRHSLPGRCFVVNSITFDPVTEDVPVEVKRNYPLKDMVSDHRLLFPVHMSLSCDR